MDGQVLGEQIIAGIAGRDLDDIADSTDVFDAFFEQEFDGCHDLESSIFQLQSLVSATPPRSGGIHCRGGPILPLRGGVARGSKTEYPRP
jgi:hypothetical protein